MLDISVSASRNENGFPKGRPQSGKGKSFWKWPRIYGEGTWTIKAKCWELRNYNPTIDLETSV